MKDGKFKDHKRKDHHHGGAKTFRRGRAIAFLEMMNLKRSTLKQQLDSQEFQSIHPIIVGELKAIDMVISEFIQLFELHEGEAVETDPKDVAAEGLKNEGHSNKGSAELS